jgi:hypothetical protein
MLRHGMRRCAQRASCATGASQILRQRVVSPLNVTPKVPSPKLLFPLQRYGLSAYSTTAAATGEVAHEDSAGADKVYFKDMKNHGVHQRLISAITEGMKYETMTQVQAKTIVAALKGTDMYVFDTSTMPLQFRC